MNIRAVTYSASGAIGVVREDGARYDFVFGEKDCAEQLAGFLGVPLTDDFDKVSRSAVIDALRAGHRNDSAADQVEYVSDLVGWSAEDDPEL